MNLVHYRRLMRVALITIAAVLLFNFFTYYLSFTASKENKHAVEILSSTAAQRLLGQRISNTSLLLLLNTGLAETAAADTRQHLDSAIIAFEKQQQQLLQQVSLPEGTGQWPVDEQLKNDTRNNAGSFLATTRHKKCR